MKKILLFITMIALTLVSCSDSDKDGNKSEKAQKITVGIFGTPTETKGFQELANEFEAETGISVTIKQYADFFTEVKTEFIGGTAPDVFYADVNVFDFYVENGLLLPLTDKIDTSAFNANLVESFSKDGELYAIPKDYSTLALYYNKKYVNPEDLPKTYQELPAYLRKLQAELPSGVVPMTYNLDLARNMHIAEATGKDIIGENGLSTLGQEEIAKNLNVVFDIAKEGLLKTPGDLGMGWNGEAFGNEKNALMIEGNWTVGFLDENFPDVDYGVTTIPTLNGKELGMLFTVGYGVNSKSEHPDAAIEFVKFMTRKENAKKWAEISGTLPSRDDVAIELKLTENEVFAPHVKAADYSTPWRKGITLDAVNREYINYLTTAVGDDKDTLETLKKVDEEVNKIIKASQN